MMNHNSNITFGQLMMRDKEYRNDVIDYLKEGYFPSIVINNNEAKPPKIVNSFPQNIRKTAVREYDKFKTKSIQLTFDTGSGISLMSRSLARKLGLKIFPLDPDDPKAK